MDLAKKLQVGSKTADKPRGFGAAQKHMANMFC